MNVNTGIQSPSFYLAEVCCAVLIIFNLSVGIENSKVFSFGMCTGWVYVNLTQTSVIREEGASIRSTIP